jgi:tyrosyl-tRNA synthetase
METRGITSLLGNLPALSLAEVVARVFGVSKSGARRLIDSGGIRINGSQQFVDRELTRSELENATLQRGKRSFVLLTDD